MEMMEVVMVNSNYGDASDGDDGGGDEMEMIVVVRFK